MFCGCCRAPQSGLAKAARSFFTVDPPSLSPSPHRIFPAGATSMVAMRNIRQRSRCGGTGDDWQGRRAAVREGRGPDQDGAAGQRRCACDAKSERVRVRESFLAVTRMVLKWGIISERRGQVGRKYVGITEYDVVAMVANDEEGRKGREGELVVRVPLPSGECAEYEDAG